MDEKLQRHFGKYLGHYVLIGSFSGSYATRSILQTCFDSLITTKVLEKFFFEPIYLDTDNDKIDFHILLTKEDYNNFKFTYPNFEEILRALFFKYLTAQLSISERNRKNNEKKNL